MVVAEVEEVVALPVPVVDVLFEAAVDAVVEVVLAAELVVGAAVETVDEVVDEEVEAVELEEDELPLEVLEVLEAEVLASLLELELESLQPPMETMLCQSPDSSP